MSAPVPRAGVSPRDSNPTQTQTTRLSLQQLQQLLPTCQRCRRLRRKCDTQLPNCQPCHRAGVECTIFDHALKQALPRAYVQSLITRVEHLEAVKGGGTDSGADSRAVPSESQAPRPRIEQPPPPPPPSYDVVVPSTAAAGKSRFWGASSVFALMVEILQHATARGYVSLEDIGAASDADTDHDHDEQQATDLHHHYYNANNLAGDSAASAAAEADIRALLRLYLASSNTLYGFVDAEQTTADLDVYLAVRRQQKRQGSVGSMTSPPGGGGHASSAHSPNITTTTTTTTTAPAALGDQAHSYFRIAMMCAIACATKARYRPQRTAESLAYYADALAYVEEVTAEVSPASLQALLLLIVFCLFFPRRGDVWKLLDYACRLALELGYHTEGSGPDARATYEVASDESEAQRKLRRSTFWGLYAIERIVGQLFGRGSDLPESIITVAYPSVPSSASSSSSAPSATTIDSTAMQAMSIAHHYRLVYLRSEIFRTLYLPARPSPGGSSNSSNDCELDWLRRQYQTLHAWRQELAVPAGDEREGVATLTCDVGYDATMCFLFQPLLLRALRIGGEGEDAQNVHVAADPFYSSIRLIRTYEKIIRAPETSAQGAYPMTFMSAHYIQLASSTLLAHALLRLDGRVAVLPPMGDDRSDAPTELDWGAYVDVSSSCLILLAWCGERWPGMLGMLGVYQRLFGRTIRELIGKAIVR